MLVPWKKSYDQPRQHIKKQRHYCANKGPSSQSYGFSSSHLWMWELDYKESWVPKNWCFCTAVLEKTLGSPLDSKEIQPVHPKGNQSWIFIGRTDVEAQTPIVWPPDVKHWLIWKDPDTGQEMKEGGERDDRGWDGWMASPTQWTWVWVNSRSLLRLPELLMDREAWSAVVHGHESERAPGVGDGQGGLACCSPWSCKELDMTEWLNWTRCFSIVENVYTNLINYRHRLMKIGYNHEVEQHFCSFLSYVTFYNWPCINHTEKISFWTFFPRDLLIKYIFPTGISSII